MTKEEALENPARALIRANDRLDADTLKACALKEPERALMYASDRLDAETLKACALKEPLRALEYAIDRLDAETLTACALEEPVRALTYASDLLDADTIAEISAPYNIVPQTGDLIGWKKLKGGVICKLLIKDGTPRNSAFGRKCRCERATVLEGDGASIYDGNTRYEVGKEVVSDKYDTNRWNECSGGIHFFLTKEEAEEYEL